MANFFRPPMDSRVCDIMYLRKEDGEMDISENLLCLFNSQVVERNGSYVIEVLEREITLGDIQPGQVYRVAVLSPVTEPETERDEPAIQRERQHDVPKPPVEEGDTVEVEIEDIGEQGDGIARVERGYVVIVPDTEMGDRVTVEITDVRQNVAFAEVIEGPY